jgi:hypothetical protein
VIIFVYPPGGCRTDWSAMLSLQRRRMWCATRSRLSDRLRAAGQAHVHPHYTVGGSAFQLEEISTVALASISLKSRLLRSNTGRVLI